jgi:hypothetical protein
MEVQQAKARVDTAQQAVFVELQRAQQRERQLAAERAAAARERAAQEHRSAAQRAATHRELRAAAVEVRAALPELPFVLRLRVFHTVDE